MTGPPRKLRIVIHIAMSPSMFEQSQTNENDGDHGHEAEDTDDVGDDAHDRYAFLRERSRTAIVITEIPSRMRPVTLGSPIALDIWSFKPGSPKASAMLPRTWRAVPTNARQ